MQPSAPFLRLLDPVLAQAPFFPHAGSAEGIEVDGIEGKYYDLIDQATSW